MPAQPQTSTLPLIGLVIGVWANLPPYIKIFGDLNVEDRVEIADHVLPGSVVLAVSVLGYFLLRSPTPSQMLLFVCGGLITLAGFWMVVTHVGLISQARQNIVPAGAVAWHGLPGVTVTLLGLVWTIRFWASDDTDDAPPAQ